MTTIAIHLPDEQAERLAEVARDLNISVEELAAARVLEVCQENDERFKQVLQYVLKKNAELYRRLA